MASSPSKKKKKKVSKKSSTIRSSSLFRTLLVGIVLGVLLFVFLLFVITALPDKLQGQRDVRTSLEQIFFETPAQPFIFLGTLGGYSFSKEILLFLTVLSYAFIGIFANVIWQAWQTVRRNS